jgi:hypothetical protein
MKGLKRSRGDREEDAQMAGATDAEDESGESVVDETTPKKARV